MLFGADPGSPATAFYRALSPGKPQSTRSPSFSNVNSRGPSTVKVGHVHKRVCGQPGIKGPSARSSTPTHTLMPFRHHEAGPLGLSAPRYLSSFWMLQQRHTRVRALAHAVSPHQKTPAHSHSHPTDTSQSLKKKAGCKGQGLAQLDGNPNR